MEQSVEQQPQGPEMGAVARVVNVFFSPGKTFESIGRKPGWVLPVGLLLLLTIGGGYLVLPKFDVAAIAQKRIEAAEAQGQTVPEEQQEQAEKIIGTMIKFQPILAAVFVVLALLIVPSLYHALAAAFGKAGKWNGVFSAYAHIQMIPFLKGIVTTLIMLPRSKIDPESIPFLLKSNVGAFLDPEATPRFVRSLLANVDLFEIWGVVLGIIALPRVTRLGKGAAAGIVIGLWLLWVLITSGLAALGG